jgi:hypothetical protein
VKIRKPAQTNAARDIPGAILAKRFLEVQRLRDEVLKAELAATAARRRPEHFALWIMIGCGIAEYLI